MTKIEDIAPIVTFLATEGWWITGQILFANGRLHHALSPSGRRPGPFASRAAAAPWTPSPAQGSTSRRAQVSSRPRTPSAWAGGRRGP
ncbi:hypothetical protein [Streptomyces echinatus]|uniref:SDR family oxidoreductase n=1 Tax=Streptomyces echinatus TaxID=67293 RepID=A0A7W9Q2N7_9ACTN|nr:hypothetical protein [Streptomyces echinatus]